MNEIPSKINSKVNCKGEELKNDELRTEMNQGDKVKHCPDWSNFNGRMSIPPKQGHFGGGGNVAKVREHLPLITMNVREHSQTSRAFE